MGILASVPQLIGFNRIDRMLWGDRQEFNRIDNPGSTGVQWGSLGFNRIDRS